MWQIILAFAFGVAFLITLLALAFVFPNPTNYQYTICRIVLAIAAAGFATVLTGFIEVEIPGVAKAGGALAVFLIIYFKSPASLVAQQEPGPAPPQP